MLSMNIESITDDSLKYAAELLLSGQLVAFATETVYGLGADATNDKAVAEIFAVKGRPDFNPLIIHVADTAMAKTIVAWNGFAETLSHAFWPGPLTLILPRLPGSSVSLLAGAGGDTLGVRIPAQEGARALCAALGRPVAAPSANRSGRVSPTLAQHVYAELGDAVPLILDGGACKVGIESSVLDISGELPVLLRPGFITSEQIESVLGRKIAANGESGGVLKSPGQLASHYAPSLPVRLNVTSPGNGEALLAFGAAVPLGAETVINLSIAGDLKEAAAHLFAALRLLDDPRYKAIAVMPVPETGLGIAINDRLRRAAVR